MLFEITGKQIDAVKGTQSLVRGLTLLKLLSNYQREGMTLTEVIAESGLDRATTHRLLSSLVHEGFVEKNAATKRYRLGVGATLLGSASLRHMPMVEPCLPMLMRLARIAGDTVFLMLRQESHAFCLHREEADSRVKVLTINAGEKRLLGIGAGGLAMMSRMTNEEIAAIHAENVASYRSTYSLPSLMSAVRRAREKHYAEVVDTVTVGVSGVGAAIDIRDVVISVSFGAISSRLDLRRREELGHLLVRELDQLKASLEA